eukprot:COSAG04_NODE_861_length_9806_cov_5.052127_6_plen_119_part_00
MTQGQPGQPGQQGQRETVLVLLLWLLLQLLQPLLLRRSERPATHSRSLRRISRSGPMQARYCSSTVLCKQQVAAMQAASCCWWSAVPTVCLLRSQKAAQMKRASWTERFGKKKAAGGF